MPYGVRQFLMTDPDGNCLRIGQPIAESFEHDRAKGEVRAGVASATLLEESKGDAAALSGSSTGLWTGKEPQPGAADEFILIFLGSESLGQARR
jgi:hypothetical protein